jgi:peptidyl-prolyl cis-trans isomerase C
VKSFTPLAVFVCAFSLSAQTPSTTEPKPKPSTSVKPATPGAKPAAAVPAKKDPVTKPATPAVAKTDAVPEGKVVLTVGSEKITEKQFDALIEALGQKGNPDPGLRRKVAEQIIRVEAMAQEARKRGIDKEPGFQVQARFQMENMLAGAFYKELQAKTPTDDAAIRSYYEQHKSEGEEANARHILIRVKGSQVPAREGKKELTEEEALAKATEIRKKLVAGEDFAKLAKEESDDSGSGQNGGDLGTFKRGQMVPAFDQAAFSLPEGQLSEPIKTQFGYHIIKVEKRTTKTFDQMKPDIEKKLKPEAANKAVEEIRKQATVVFDDAYFGPEQKPEVKQ